MTSSQPVTTPQAINFTPDNKHAYAYSGVVSAGASTRLILFNTNSEYIDALISWTMNVTGLDTNENWGWSMKFNDVLVYDFLNDTAIPSGGALFNASQNPLRCIIPPFTKVEILGSTSDGSGLDMSVVIAGKAYGMTDTGYQ